jgi:hypothetical protein
MFVKTLITAAAFAASLALLAAPQASAKTVIDIDVGLGLGGFGGYYGGGYDPYYPVVDPGFGGGVSCNKGRKIVKWAGFKNVTPFDCSAPVYGYKAWKWGNPYKVRVNWQGDIVSVKPL